jgi:hypothetical protein
MRFGKTDVSFRSLQLGGRDRDLEVFLRTGVPSHALDRRTEFPFASGVEDAQVQIRPLFDHVAKGLLGELNLKPSIRICVVRS